jgi:Sulfatase-modifying factor enzyme 1
LGPGNFYRGSPLISRFFAALVFFCASFVVAPLPASAITIDTVFVGNPGNADDPRDGDNSTPGIQNFGAVAYSYRIGKTEVTIDQFTEFLNAVSATDTYGLYNTNMASNLDTRGIPRRGSPGSYQYFSISSASRPIAFVSWADAARFANWMHNGQPGLGGPAVPQNSASTEDGAYTLNGAITNAALNGVSRNVGARWFIPTESEWYKAAYYEPHEPGANGSGAADNWAFPTRHNSGLASDQPPGDPSIQTNVANFYNFNIEESVTRKSRVLAR